MRVIAKKPKTGVYKGKYQDWLKPEGLLKIEGWARDGLIDEQIAENIGIARSTLATWKNNHPDILDALKKGKEVVDRQVENALLKRALGYSYVEEKVKVGIDGTETTTTVKQVVPDTTAQIFWLKNRKPEQWRDRPVLDDQQVLDKLDSMLASIDKAAKADE